MVDEGVEVVDWFVDDDCDCCAKELYKFGSSTATLNLITALFVTVPLAKFMVLFNVSPTLKLPNPL